MADYMEMEIKQRYDELNVMFQDTRPVSAEEAAELSWRYMNTIFDGNCKHEKRCLDKISKLFMKILEGKCSNKKLNKLLQLPSTRLWIKFENNRQIKLR